jgi:hypothetical protein
MAGAVALTSRKGVDQVACCGKKATTKKAAPKKTAKKK